LLVRQRPPWTSSAPPSLNAALVDASTAASSSLNEQAKHLAEVVALFKVG
jgi:hypothetical protein